MKNPGTPYRPTPLCSLGPHCGPPTHMVLKGHILPGHAHVGLGDARLDDHFPQELSIQLPGGEARREGWARSSAARGSGLSHTACSAQYKGPPAIPPCQGLTFAWLGWRSMRLSPKGGSSRESAHRERKAKLWQLPWPNPWRRRRLTGLKENVW